jgi:uncharacterized cupredoxin-like copper-binding protein
MYRRTTRIALLFIAALALAACLPQKKTVTVDLYAEDIRWSETDIQVEAGTELILRIENRGVLEHDFVITELDLHVHLMPDHVQEVSLTFDEPGVIEFHCEVPGHLEAGMQGAITVTEP